MADKFEIQTDMAQGKTTVKSDPFFNRVGFNKNRISNTLSFYIYNKFTGENPT
jgi:hypothetical protein